MRTAVIGLGLIGGSMAKSIRKFTDDLVFGYDISPEVLKKALEDGTLDGTATDSELALCDYVFIALYPQAAIDFIIAKKAIFKKSATVIDCCGVKKKITDAVNEIEGETSWSFIGGHPMAGKEVSGYENSDEALWQDSYFIMTPCKKTDKASQEKAAEYIKRLGFKEITVTSPEHHDKVIAYTSQLPHALACAYVFNPVSREHSGFSAGSYKDVSRVALINEALWTELFLDNSDALCGEIGQLICDLEDLKNLISHKDREKLREKLKTGRLIKAEIN